MGWQRTSCASLLGTKIDLGTGGEPPFETALHRVLLVDPLHLHPAAARRGGALGLFRASRWRGELAEIVQHADAHHAIFGAVRILGAPAPRVVLQAEHDVARGRRGVGRLRLLALSTWIRNGSNESL